MASQKKLRPLSTLTKRQVSNLTKKLGKTPSRRQVNNRRAQLAGYKNYTEYLKVREFYGVTQASKVRARKGATVHHSTSPNGTVQTWRVDKSMTRALCVRYLLQIEKQVPDQEHVRFVNVRFSILAFNEEILDYEVSQTSMNWPDFDSAIEDIRPKSVGLDEKLATLQVSGRSYATTDIEVIGIYVKWDSNFKPSRPITLNRVYNA